VDVDGSYDQHRRARYLNEKVAWSSSC